MIGRHRPVEPDAFRILVEIHQLGARQDRRWFIQGERTLQSLDHLVQQPIALAYVALIALRSRDPPAALLKEAADRIRRLLNLPRTLRHRRSIAETFEIGTWTRWDDCLAYLKCRNLLAVSPIERDDLRYELTDQAIRWLDDSLSSMAESTAELGRIVERCVLLRMVFEPKVLNLPERLAETLREVGPRLTVYRQEEQLALEDDLISRLFQATFLEPL